MVRHIWSYNHIKHTYIDARTCLTNLCVLISPNANTKLATTPSWIEHAYWTWKWSWRWDDEDVITWSLNFTQISWPSLKLPTLTCTTRIPLSLSHTYSFKAWVVTYQNAPDIKAKILTIPVSTLHLFRMN